MENTDFIKLAKEAKKASVKAQGLCSDTKNKALKAVAKAIEDNKQKIFDANKIWNLQQNLLKMENYQMPLLTD